MRLDTNRFGEMEVFISVGESASFSAAARRHQMTPSAVSKLISRLETRLGVRLVTRSTRKLQLTAEGVAFYDRAVRILADLGEAERAAGLGDLPSGRVRINTSASFATHILFPLLPEFIARYPGITLDIVQTDAVIDLLGERTDIALRSGPLKSSSLVARKLGATPMIIVGAPSYFERFGMPESVGALEAHHRIGFCYSRLINDWPLLDDGRAIALPPSERVRASDGEGLRQMALAGIGLARLGGFTVRADIAAGRLLPVLANNNPADIEEVHAVYAGQGGNLPARMRVMLDFLAERARVD